MFITQILAGWCLGAMIISTVGFASTYFFPLTTIHTLLLMVIQYVISFILLFRRSKIIQTPFTTSLIPRFEKLWPFYLSLIIIGSSLFIFQKQAFSSFPARFPPGFRPCFGADQSLVSSIIKGINYQRKNFFTFSDPYLYNGTFTISSLPSIYTAYLMNLGCSYIDASIIISFLNILAASTGISVLSYFYCPNSLFLAPLLYFFNGGSIITNYFTGSKNHIPDFIVENITLSLYQQSPHFYNTMDGVHNCGRGEAPHYSILPMHFAFSKISSFSIPLTLFALAFLHASKNASKVERKRMFLLSGVFAIFIPSLSTSISFFLVASAYIHGYLILLPCALSLIPKFFSSSFRLLPVWTEYQMNGIFFSQIVAFTDSIGIPYIFLFFTPFVFFKDWQYLFQFISCFISFIVFCFVREGYDTFANDISYCSILIPILTMNFLRILNTIRSFIDKMSRRSFLNQFSVRNQNEINELEGNELISSIENYKKPFNHWSQFLGAYNFFYYLLVFYILLSGVLSMYFMQKDQIYGIDESSRNIADIIDFKVPKDKIIFCAPRGLNPVPLLTGRQVLLGRFADTWRRGENIEKQMNLFEQICLDPIESMKKLHINYLLEFKPNLFLFVNQSFYRYFAVMEENDKWALFYLKSAY